MAVEDEDDDLLERLAAERLRRIKAAVAARRKQVIAALAAFLSSGQGPQGKKRREAAFSWDDHLAGQAERGRVQATLPTYVARLPEAARRDTVGLDRYGPEAGEAGEVRRAHPAGGQAGHRAALPGWRLASGPQAAVPRLQVVRLQVRVARRGRMQQAHRNRVSPSARPPTPMSTTPSSTTWRARTSTPSCASPCATRNGVSTSTTSRRCRPRTTRSRGR